MKEAVHRHLSCLSPARRRTVGFFFTTLVKEDVRMLRRSWTICSMAALLLAAPAVAQQPGTLILGGFGQYTMFDDNLNLKDAFGYGGRIGAFISPNAFLEAEGSYTQPDWDGTAP